MARRLKREDKGRVAVVSIVGMFFVLFAVDLPSQTLDPVSGFKRFVSGPIATNLSLSFYCSIERHLGGDVEVTGIANGSITQTRTNGTYQRLIFDNGSFFMARSASPLENAFTPQSGFCARFLGTNSVWDVNPSGQIIYDLNKLSALQSSPENRTEQSISFDGYAEIQLLRSLCIDVKIGTLSWNANTFTGTEETHGAPDPARQISGHIVVSNGFPVGASYLIGSDLTVSVDYSYSNLLGIEIPSQIVERRFFIEPDGKPVPVTTKTFHILDASFKISSQAKQLLDPEFLIKRPVDFLEFSKTDLVRLSSLASLLNHPAGNDGVSQFIRSRLGNDTISLLTEGISEELRECIVRDLNSIIRSGPIYTAERFRDVQLGSNTVQLIQQQPTGEQLTELNARLLLDRYPLEISKFGRPPKEVMMKGGKPIAVRAYDGTWKGQERRASGSATTLVRWILFVLMILPLAAVAVRKAIKYKSRQNRS